MHRVFSIAWVSSLKTGPQSKKGVCMKEKKWHQNLNNASFNRATTKRFWSIVNFELGNSENVVLTWPLTSWFLFTGLFFNLKNLFVLQKWIFLIKFIRILWFIWDLVLMLFDSHKEVVSGRVLFFWQYFEFSRGKLGPKIDQNLQLWVRPVSA